MGKFEINYTAFVVCGGIEYNFHIQKYSYNIQNVIFDSVVLSGYSEFFKYCVSLIEAFEGEKLKSFDCINTYCLKSKS